MRVRINPNLMPARVHVSLEGVHYFRSIEEGRQWEGSAGRDLREQEDQTYRACLDCLYDFVSGKFQHDEVEIPDEELLKAVEAMRQRPTEEEG